VTAFKEYEIMVECGPTSQTVDLTSTDDVLFFEVDKNTDVVEVIDTAGVEALFTEAVVGQCPIQTYELVHSDNDTAIAVGDDDYALFDLANLVANELSFLTTIEG